MGDLLLQFGDSSIL